MKTCVSALRSEIGWGISHTKNDRIIYIDQRSNSEVSTEIVSVCAHFVTCYNTQLKIVGCGKFSPKTGSFILRKRETSTELLGGGGFLSKYFRVTGHLDRSF
jgi:hypothetical protein